ncbi:MAG: putative membrane spanning protein [Parcubacteria group bacterium Gr01-1014_19]|nr:MAG: putative membrane spanning protein [Parcubacteria group bacterium Gr01-1014_19]
METSIFLAKVIGLIAVIASLAMLTRYRKMIELEIEVTKIPGLMLLAGFGILVLGALMVVSHNIWIADWPVIITILGWSMLLKGTGRIFFPEAVKYMIEKKRTVRWFILGEIVVLVVGAFLLYQGFIAN